MVKACKGAPLNLRADGQTPMQPLRGSMTAMTSGLARGSADKPLGFVWFATFRLVRFASNT